MLRVGLCFEELTSKQQADLDLYVTSRMCNEIRYQRHLMGALYQSPGTDRRQARRFAPGELCGLVAVLGEVGVGERQPVSGGPSATDGPPRAGGMRKLFSFNLQDISATGCSFFCPDPRFLRPDDRLHLRLADGDFSVEVIARVVYTRTVLASDRS